MNHVYFLMLFSAETKTYKDDSKYSRMDQVKFFKGDLPPILLGPFLIILTQIIFYCILIKAFYANGPFLYSLKMSENYWFSDVFRGYRNGTLT